MDVRGGPISKGGRAHGVVCTFDEQGVVELLRRVLGHLPRGELHKGAARHPCHVQTHNVPVGIPGHINTHARTHTNTLKTGTTRKVGAKGDPTHHDNNAQVDSMGWRMKMMERRDSHRATSGQSYV